MGCVARKRILVVFDQIKIISLLSYINWLEINKNIELLNVASLTRATTVIKALIRLCMQQNFC